MSLFACRECSCVENTALSRYHWRQGQGLPPLCSACDPDIGQWHGHFPRESASGMLQGADGFLYRPEWQIHHTTIVGIVP